MTLAQMTHSTEVVRRLEWGGVPHGWGAVFVVALVVALLYAIMWMYRREGRAGASMKTRTFLAVLRCIVILGLVAIWLEPMLATYLQRRIESYVLTLVDASASMRIKDRYRDADLNRAVREFLGSRQSNLGQVSRAELAEQVLSGDLLRDLAKKNRVKVYTFAEDAHHVSTLPANRERTDADDSMKAGAPAALKVSATGNSTNVGRAVRRAIESLGGAPVSAVILLSDGVINQGEPADVVGQYLRTRQAPLFAVGIGDAAKPRNARVVEVLAPSHAFAQDPFTITAQLSAEGLGGETLEVELLEGEIPLARKSITVPADGRINPAVFEHTARTSGRKIYRVRVAEQQDESLLEDNTRQVILDVIDNKMRVLLVAGSPSWQYRYLARLLERDATVEVSCWLQAAGVQAVRDGNVIIDHLPATDEELFEYDVIVLVDPDPDEFSRALCRSLARLVTDYGGGLVYAAARKHTGRLVRRADFKPLLDVLPVTFDPDADLVLNEMGHYQTTRWGVGVPPESLDHPILSAGTQRMGRDTWAELADVYWHYPVLREKPAATVLMRHSNPRMQNAYGPHVLLATQMVGAGRTIFLAFDGTWRWRRFGDEYFNRFWIRSLRYVMEGKLLGGRRRAVLMTDRDTHTVGETVVVTARLLNKSYEPLVKEEIKGSVARQGEEKRQLIFRAIPGREGWYQAEWVAPGIGIYRIEITLAGGGADPVQAVQDIQVETSDRELERPQMDRETLKVLAEQSAGGRYFDIDQVDQIPALIEDRHQAFEIPGRPVVLWDSWWTLAAFVLLLGVEWTVRKLSRLL